MRILVTGFTDNMGGIETLVMNYYRQMKYADEGTVVDLIGYSLHPAFEKEILKYGGKVYTVPSPAHFNSYRKILNFFKSHAQDYDVLWCNKCELYNIDYLKAAKKCGLKKRILHSHNSSNMYSGLRKTVVNILHKINKNRAEHYATDFWACSDYAAEWLFTKSICKSGKVQYIPNAVDAKRFRFNKDKRDEQRKKLNLNGKTVIGSIGRLTFQKNPLFAIDVFEQIYKKTSNVVFLVVGVGDLEKQVKLKAENMTCANAIHFLGKRDDIPDLMQAMDCILLPSHFEGLPVVAVEAQAAGLAVFAASDGITPQTKLTDLVHFMPLSDGAEKWADKILNTRLERRDTFDEMVNAGFEITEAGENLYKRFSSMQNGER